jgi:hypothetical protein
MWSPNFALIIENVDSTFDRFVVMLVKLVLVKLVEVKHLLPPAATASRRVGLEGDERDRPGSKRRVDVELQRGGKSLASDFMASLRI